MATTFKFGGGNWAVKDGYALAYNDENNNFKPLPFDFTRASTATRVNKQGLIETVPSGKPRIDFLNNTSGHLLLEPSRTNYITQSIDLADWASFVASGTVTRTNNYSTSPDGLNKATRLQMSGGSSTQWTYLNVSNSATYSTFYVKSTGSSSQNFRWFWNNGSNGQDFTATTEWQRFEVAVSQSSTLPMGFTTHSDLSASDILVWGVQAENGSYATSYIPTEGSSVTRVAETSEINSVPNVPTSYPFVMYVEGNHTLGQESGVCGFYDKSNQFQYYSILFSSNNKVLAISRQPGIENVLTSTSTYTDGFHKIAVLFLNDTTIKLYVDGELDSTKTDCSNNSFNTAFTDYVIGVFRSNSTNSCNIKDFRIFNHELTDTELKNLTS